MSERRTERCGFTLIEMLVVIAILAIVGAVTLPAARLNSEDELARASALLTNLIQRSRQTAVERGESVSLIVDAENARYWAIAVAPDHPDSVVSYGTIDLPSGATLTADDSRTHFTFGPSGSVSGQPLTLEMDGGAALITVNQWTGDVRAVFE